MALSIFSPPLSKTLFSLSPYSLLSSSSSPRQYLTSITNNTITRNSYLLNHQLKYNKKTSYRPPKTSVLSRNPSFTRHTCRAAEYKFPDPIPEFADAETEKFKTHLLKKLSRKDVCGNSIQEVVGICTEIFSTFLHSEYGGPGTLLVIPFIDMADTINERGLPGGPQAARAAVKWAQAHVDKDWDDWNGDSSS